MQDMLWDYDAVVAPAKIDVEHERVEFFKTRRRKRRIDVARRFDEESIAQLMPGQGKGIHVVIEDKYAIEVGGSRIPGLRSDAVRFRSEGGLNHTRKRNGEGASQALAAFHGYASTHQLD